MDSLQPPGDLVQTPPPAPAPKSPDADPNLGPTPVMIGRGRKKQMIIGGVISAAILAVAIGFGVFAYIMTTPNYMMRQATDKLAAQQSYSAQIKLVNGTDTTNVTVGGSITVRVDPTNNKNAEAVLAMGEGDKRVVLTTRLVDGTLYIHIGELTHLPAFFEYFSLQGPGGTMFFEAPGFAEKLGGLNNTWFQVDLKELSTAIQYIAAIGTIEAINLDDFKKLKEIYDRQTFLVSDQSYADETMEGVASAHFSLKEDVPAGARFMADLKAANLATFKVQEQEVVYAGDETLIDPAHRIEAWVGRSDRQLKQLRLVDTLAGREMTLTLTFTNEAPTPEQIQKPKDVRLFKELLTSLFGPLAPPSL